MAPREDLITPLGWEFINALPPILRDDPTYRAIMHCSAKEAERLEASIQYVRAQLNPLTASDEGLTWWETLLHLPSGGPDLTTRRTRVIGRYRALDGDPSGANWIARLNDRIGTTWSYFEHVPGDPTSPDPHVLRMIIPALPATPAWDRIVAVIREETPAEIDFEFISGEGFLLDIDSLDEGTLGI